MFRAARTNKNACDCIETGSLAPRGEIDRGTRFWIGRCQADDTESATQGERRDRHSVDIIVIILFLASFERENRHGDGRNARLWRDYQ